MIRLGKIKLLNLSTSSHVFHSTTKVISRVIDKKRTAATKNEKTIKKKKKIPA